MRAKACLFALVLCAVVACGRPTEFPAEDITVVIPFNSGGGFDTYVRALAPNVEKYLQGDVNVLPKNLPGAGGRRGASDVFRARPDGYTIGIFNMPGVLIPQLQGIPTQYDLARVTWLATIGYDPYVFAVRGDSPFRSIEDLKRLGRTISFGATGPGSTAYVATSIVSETLDMPYDIVTGYTGSSAYLLGLIRGDFDAAMISLASARAYLESGDIRAIAVFGSESSDPVIADAHDLGVPELAELRLVRMLGAPPDLPEDIKGLLESALIAAMQDADFEAWLARTGNVVHPANAQQTAHAVLEMRQFYERFKPLLD